MPVPAIQQPVGRKERRGGRALLLVGRFLEPVFGGEEKLTKAWRWLQAQALGGDGNRQQGGSLRRHGTSGASGTLGKEVAKSTCGIGVGLPSGP